MRRLTVDCVTGIQTSQSFMPGLYLALSYLITLAAMLGTTAPMRGVSLFRSALLGPHLRARADLDCSLPLLSPPQHIYDRGQRSHRHLLPLEITTYISGKADG